jgi:cobalt/nickel transport system ATP-binding protein
VSLLRVCNLSHRFADGRQALEGLSFEIAAQERVALVGPNGAGKTTLFLRLCGVIPGRPGEIQIANLDPARPADARQLPRQIGIVFQNPDDQLFSATLLEDVAFGPLCLGVPSAEARQMALESLRALGLAGAEDRSPHRLSGGEKRRAALAGVLAMKPDLLLLDEPSMFLDPRGRRELIRTIQQIPGALLLATHDLDLVLETCPRTLVLDGGRLAADGPTSQLLADAGLMEAHGLEVPHRLSQPRT